MLSGTESTISENVANVMNQITRVAQRVRRDSRSVKLVAVSKTVPPELVKQALDAGVTCLGENRVQEGMAKRPHLLGRTLEYHLIGPLQKNKVLKAVACFDWIETIDSSDLAEKIENACRDQVKLMPVLVQVNLAKEETKSGVNEEGLLPLLEQLLAFPHLSVRGLMTIPPFQENPEEVRPYFRRLRQLLDLVMARTTAGAEFKELSMGMSHDYPVAVEEGVTIIRVGTAIFGARSNN